MSRISRAKENAMSRRAEITMSDADLHAFLAEERVVTCATIGANGRPHLMPLWYVADGAVISAWTYGRSQKVRNVERVPQATLLVESGHGYDELRGAMLECDVEIVRDAGRLETLGLRLARRYRGLPDGEVSPDVRAAVLKQGAKRVGLVFHPTRIVTWDHRKLGGGY
jgi:PPOX class probable F420-dependent enzyme